MTYLIKWNIFPVRQKLAVFQINQLCHIQIESQFPFRIVILFIHIDHKGKVGTLNYVHHILPHTEDE